MIMEIILKYCKYCNETKEETLFVPKGISKKTGEILRRCKCKKCYNKNRDLTRKRNQSPVRLEGVKRRCKSDSYKNQQLKRQYGITLEEYNDMKESQQGRCKICNTIPEKLCIDHCHTTGVIRGLLCNNCNLGLGGFKDNQDILQDAIIYLNNSKL